jgi:uncharacterized membrane protein YgcG
MKNIQLFLFLVLLSSKIALNAQSYTVKTVPNPKTANNSWVSDPDNFLKGETVQVLNGKINAIEELNGTEVAVVVLKSIGSGDPADFASELFNYWGVGKKSSNAGLLILMVMDKRRVEFRTGYGLEETLTDGLCVQIQQKYMVPEFKKGDYDRGMIAGLDATAKILVGDTRWEIEPLKDELLIMEAQAAKKGRSSGKVNYVVDMDNIAADSVLKTNNILASIIEDSTNLTIRIYLYQSLQGVSPAKMSAYLREKTKIESKNGNLCFLVIDREAKASNLYYEFADSLNYFNEPLLMNYIRDAIAQIIVQAQPENLIFSAILEFYGTLDGSLKAKKIENQRAKELAETDVNNNHNEHNHSNGGAPFWWNLLIYYLWALSGMIALTFIFLGIVQGFKDPYKQYHTLTFFSLDIWMFLFPLPFIFLGKWIDKLRQQYRDAPRNDAATGLPMSRLSEQEEDKYLKAGQITEEQINSIHYDVWATEDRKGMLILPYPTLFSKYSRCSKCRTKAYYLVFNRTISYATTSSTGLGEKKYECKHCNHVHQYTYIIPRKSESKSSSSGGGGGGGSFGGGSSGGGGGGSSW